MTLSCPLCRASRIQTLEVLDVALLARAWRRSYGISTVLPAKPIVYASCEACALRFFSPPASGDADLYVQLQRHDWYYTADKPEYELAAPMLPREGPVLEVGSGMAAFAGHVGAARYTGLEFNDAAIARAADKGIRLLKQPVEAHALQAPGHYAAVVSFQVLEHVPDPRGFVQACIDALAPGGTLILAVPDHEGLCGLAQNNVLDLPPHHLSHWSEASLRSIAGLFGLEFVEVVREAVSAQHAAWAARAQVERELRRRLHLTPSLLDSSLASRLTGRVAAMWADRHPPPLGNLGGHTIIGRFRRPDAGST